MLPAAVPASTFFGWPEGKACSNQETAILLIWLAAKSLSTLEMGKSVAREPMDSTSSIVFYQCQQGASRMNLV